MVDREYSIANFKSPEISIGAIMKNPKLIKLVPDHHKTKKYV